MPLDSYHDFNMLFHAVFRDRNTGECFDPLEILPNVQAK